MKLYTHHRAAGSKTDTLEEVRELTAPEASRYLAAIEHLHDFDQTRDLVALVSANLDVVNAEIARIESAALTQKRGALDQSPEDRRGLQRAVVNYLTSVRLYLDHRQTHLTRRYGASSAALAAFNAARRQCHKTIPEYAFVYEWRNFVQHCGMPLQVIRAKQSVATVTGAETLEAEVFIGCNRDELLSRFKDWNHSRAYIEAQPDEFPVTGILRKMAECLTKVETATINALMPALWSDGQFVTRLLAEGSDDSHIGLVADLKPAEERTSVQFRVPPFVLLDWMKLIEQTQGAPGYRIIVPHLALAVPPRVE